MSDPDVFVAPYLYLTTTGRKTGMLREIEIWFVEREGSLYVLAEYPRRSHWFRNIIAHPEVTIRIAGRHWVATGRVLDVQNDRELYAQIQELAQQKYGWGDGAPVELHLDQELTGSNEE